MTLDIEYWLGRTRVPSRVASTSVQFWIWTLEVGLELAGLEGITDFAGRLLSGTRVETCLLRLRRHFACWFSLRSVVVLVWGSPVRIRTWSARAP